MQFGVVVTLGGFAIVLSTVNFGAYLYQLATPRGAAEGFRLSRITVSIFAFFVGIVLIVAAFAWIPRNDDNKCTNNTGYATLPPLGLLPARALVETSIPIIQWTRYRFPKWLTAMCLPDPGWAISYAAPTFDTNFRDSRNPSL